MKDDAECYLSLWRGLIVAPVHNVTRSGWVSREVLQRWAEMVAAKHGLSVEQVLGRKRIHKISHARQELIWRLHNMGYRYKAIGRSLGMDHTTAIWAVKRHQERIDRAEQSRREWSLVA